MAVAAGESITREFPADIHGGKKIHVVYTNDSEQVKKILLEYEGLLRCKVGQDRFVGLDFEYSKAEESRKRVTVVQLGLNNEVLVFQCTKYKTCPLELSNFLQKKKIYFSSVDITNDKMVMQRTWGFKIPEEYHIDLQHRYRKNEQLKTGMATMAFDIIDDYYTDMKSKFHHSLHDCWEDIPLPQENLNYADVDGFVAYELNRQLDVIAKGTALLHAVPKRKGAWCKCSNEDNNSDKDDGWKGGAGGKDSGFMIEDGPSRWPAGSSKIAGTGWGGESFSKIVGGGWDSWGGESAASKIDGHDGGWDTGAGSKIADEGGWGTGGGSKIADEGGWGTGWTCKH